MLNQIDIETYLNYNTTPTFQIIGMIKVAEYILRQGPFVSTQEIGGLLGQANMNQQNSKRRKMSSEIFKRVKRYFNIIQIYFKGTGYLVENREYDPVEVAQRFDIFSKVSTQVNKHVERKSVTYWKQL
jgi:hypothetical protein